MSRIWESKICALFQYDDYLSNVLVLKAPKLKLTYATEPLNAPKLKLTIRLWVSSVSELGEILFFPIDYEFERTIFISGFLNSHVRTWKFWNTNGLFLNVFFFFFNY